MRASISPRQSPSSWILASISRDGESPCFSSFEPLLFALVMVVVTFLMVVGSVERVSSRLSGRSIPFAPRRGVLRWLGLFGQVWPVGRERVRPYRRRRFPRREQRVWFPELARCRSLSPAARPMRLVPEGRRRRR